MQHWDWDRKSNGMRRVEGGPFVLASDVRKDVIEWVEAAERLLSAKPRSVTAIDGALVAIRKAIENQ